MQQLDCIDAKGSEQNLSLSDDQTCAQKLGVPVPDGGQVWPDLISLIANACLQHDAKVIAISGSQGSGKSTLAAKLVQALDRVSDGTGTFETVSLDDYYLSRAQRARLAREVHPLLATRGVPGTHDHARLTADLSELVEGKRLTDLPVFDKGLDDAVESRQVGATRLIVEGWCLGAQKIEATALEPPINPLERDEDPDGIWRRWWNEQLATYYQPIWPMVDFWVNLHAPGWDSVNNWRREAEQKLPAERRMGEARMARFMAHYERLTRALWQQTPMAPGLTVSLDTDHGVRALSVL